MKKSIIDIYPLSFAQQGMLYDTLKAPESGIHIEQFVCTITGNLDVTAFREAWQRVINHYAILRTGFVWEADPEPVQVVLGKVDSILRQQDWRDLSQDEQNERLQAYLYEERHKPFKLSRPPLIRFALFQTQDNTYEFACTYHHILMDGWCSVILLKDFVRCYQALSRHSDIQLPPEQPYKEYIRWLKKQDVAAARVFWKQQLQGFTRPTALGREDGVIQNTVLGAGERHDTCVMDVSPTLTRRLGSHCKQQKITLNTLFQGIWALILSRYSDMDDVLFGVTVSGRPAELSNVESMIGLFINTLPMRIQLKPQESFWSWLMDIQQHNVVLRQYEYTAGSDIYQCSEIPGALLLYESLLVFENYPANAMLSQISTLDSRISNIRSIGAQTQYALTLLVTLGEQIGVRCVYDVRCFTPQAIEQLMAHFHLLLEHIVTHQQSSLVELRGLIPSQQIPVVPTVGSLLAAMPLAPYRTPRTAEEEIIAGIYEQVFGLPRVGIDDNFLEMGGHSLLATQIVARVRRQFGIELPLRTFFEFPVVAQLASRVSALLGTRQGEQRSPIVPVPRESALPASFAQQRLWFLDRMNPHSTAYNTPLEARLLGTLDIAALYKSLCMLIQRHEMLRTTFTESNGEPIQVIGQSSHQAFPIIDLQGLTEAEQEQESIRLTRAGFHLPFDLSAGPLLRVALYRLSPQKHLFVLIIHHIAFDAWSTAVLIRELTHLYEAYSSGNAPALPALPIQYADFAAWQRQWLQGNVLSELVTYWQKQLNRVPPLLLPADHSRLNYSHFYGTTVSFMLPEELSQHVYALSKKEGVTVFMTLLTAFQVLLHRYTGQEDIVLGTDIANRLHVETEMLIGFFVNLLVLRTNLGGQPRFLEALQRVRDMLLQAHAHQDLPFDLLVNALHLERTANQIPLVRALFVHQNAPLPAIRLPALEIEALQTELTASKFDLAVFITDTDKQLQGLINYSTELFEASTIQKLISHFQNLLQSIVAHPNAQIQTLEMFSEEERHQLQQKEAAQFELGHRKLKVAKRSSIQLVDLAE